ncbi:hypothetical protein AC628_10585 [Bradyrhizobium sp. NAS96.2]|nr:hypothetical protein AC628_10585 [Bradyrhizobium sp. NAS96.2]
MLPQLVHGSYEPVTAHGDVLLYRRRNAEGVAMIALNFGAARASVSSSAIGFSNEVLLSTFMDRQGEKIEGVLDLRSNEGVILGPYQDD